MSIIVSQKAVNIASNNSKSPEGDNLPTLTGIILAGGKSSRLGRNKSTEILLGKSLFHRVVESIAKVCDPILVVTSADSIIPELPSQYPMREIIDVEKNKGPLQALQSALPYSDTPYSFIASCDVPFLSSSLIERMAAMCPNNQSLDAIVPVIEGKPQVLHSIYHRRIEATIRRISSDEPRTLGITSILKELRVLFVDQKDILRTDSDLWSFFDIDNKEDLETAKRHITSLQKK